MVVAAMARAFCFQKPGGNNWSGQLVRTTRRAAEPRVHHQQGWGSSATRSRASGAARTQMRAFGSALAPVELSVNETEVGVAAFGATKEPEKGPPRWDGLVGVLRGSAPYIELHQGSIVVIHLASEVAECGEAFQDVMDDVSTLHLLGVKIVLVASVRRQIEARLGKAGTFVRGLRVTEPEDMAAARAECGVCRSRVEAALARGLRTASPVGRGRARVGVDVVSSNGFYTARPVGVLDGVDMGATGAVRGVESAKILRHLDQNEIVLLTALGYSASGDTYNVRTEEIAAKTAPALRASKVVFVTDGYELVFRDHSTHRHQSESSSNRRVQSLRLDDARRLVARKDALVAETPPVVSADPLPWKTSSAGSSADVGSDAYPALSPGVSSDLRQAAAHLVDLCEWSVSALERGVVRAHLVPPIRGAILQELYTRDGAGTMVASDIYEGVRTARVDDLERIVALIQPLERDGTLLERPRDALRRDLAAGCYYVIAREHMPIACAMLKRLDDDGAAELGCLVVHPSYRRMAKGDALLSYLEHVAIANNVTHLFALSTRTMQWFLERGFDEVSFTDLPPGRRESYDTARNPKVYRKRLRSDRHVDFEESFWTSRTNAFVADTPTTGLPPQNPAPTAGPR